MNHLNKIIIQGNLVKDPELKDLGNSQLCKFTLASNRQYKDQEETCFIDIIAWGKLAELCDKYLLKGKPVLIEGRLQQDTWETKDGDKRSKHVIVANEVVFLPTKQNNTTKDRIKDQQSISHTGAPIVAEEIDDLPF